MNEAAGKVYERLLILRCQTGDASALTELISRYSPGVRLYLSKLGAGAALDDLLQDTWFDVYRKLHTLQRAEAFPAWLYRIARDKAYRRHRRRELPAAASEFDLAELSDDAEETLSEDEAAGVRAALDQLPLELREVLLLRFVESMTYEQIAQVVNCPLGTVRSRLHYAKLALRAKLETQLNE